MEVAEVIDDNNAVLESSTELTVLKPVCYDMHDESNAKSDVYDEIDIDNQCNNLAQENEFPEKSNRKNPSDEIQRKSLQNNEFCENKKKFNRFKLMTSSLIEKPLDVTTCSTPGKSRYGRVRRPKLSIDFVSVDRKSFVVLNSSSYEHVYADECPHIVPSQQKDKLPSAKNSTVLFVKDTLPEVTSTNNENKQSENADRIENNTNFDIRSKILPEPKTEEQLNAADDIPNFGDQSITSSNSKIVKTYSRKNEINLCSTNLEDKRGIVEDNNDLNISHINHVKLNWKVGDVAWAKIGCYPYWPSIVTLEYGSSIYVKAVRKRGSRLAVHVQFFGDRGRRSWVLTTSLIKYESKDQFLELKHQYRRDKLKMKHFLIPRLQDLWEKGITEADTILKLPHEERIQCYQSIYPVSKETYAAEIANMNKIKQTPTRRRRNPNERRGRKRKILNEMKDDWSNNKTKVSTKSLSSDSETLSRDISAKSITPNKVIAENEKTTKKLRKSRKPIDEHTKERRAFMRRMNKILKQSNYVSGFPIKKNIKKALKLRSEKNEKFDKLLTEGKQKLFDETSNIHDQKMKFDEADNRKNALSVYDFDSDEETDVFIGTYNSRFNTQVLAKIESKHEDEDTMEVKAASYSNVQSNMDLDTAEKYETAGRKFRVHNKQKKRIEAKIKKKNEKYLKKNSYNQKLGKAMKTVSCLKFNSVLQAKKRGRPRKHPLIKSQIKIKKKKRVFENVKKVETMSNDEICKEKRLFADTKENRIIHKENDLKRHSEVYEKNELLATDYDDKVFMLQNESMEFCGERQSEKTSELDEIQKKSKKSQMISHEDDFDSDDYDSKSILNEIDDDSKLEEKRRSLSPQILPVTRLKKSSNMFAGLKFEKVCLICEKSGDTIRCRGPCSGTFHVECVKNNIIPTKSQVEVEVVNKSRGRGRPRKSFTSPVDNGNHNENVKNNKAEINSDFEYVNSREIHTSVDVNEARLIKIEDCKIIRNSKDNSDIEMAVDGVVKNDVKKCTSGLLQNSVDEHEKHYLANDNERKALFKRKNDISIVKENENQSTINSASTKNCLTLTDKTEDNIPNMETDLAEKKIANSLPVDVIDVNYTVLASNISPAVHVDNCDNKMLDENDTTAQNEENKKTSINVINLNNAVDDSRNSSDLINNSASPVLSKTENQIKWNKTERFKSLELKKNDIKKTNVQFETDSDTGTVENNLSISTDEREDKKKSGLAGNNSPIENEEPSSSDLSFKVGSANSIDFRCSKCINNEQYPCFTCGRNSQEKTGETERYSCYLASCGRVYHKECLKAWPQATWRGNNSTSKMIRSSVNTKEILMCPQHYCHTCISDNPAVQKNKQSNEILVRCIRCPTAYHKRVHCIPAGTEVLTMSQIICPRHYEPPRAKHAHFNTSWCFICCIGGSLICCDECPTSFHAECLKLRPEEYEGRYICDDCQTGRYLLYGEVAWVKLGHYRWWPAQILYPNHIPENILNLPHRRGEFAVKFFGSQNYNWVNRGRAFLYQEGDSGKKNCRKSYVDMTFEKAMIEAEKVYQKLKVDKAARDEEAKLGLKPPRYVRIKTNKPVGNVRIVELNTSNITSCECDPNSDRPCARDSDCLNRMLLVECNPLTCPAGDRCHNQAFEKRIYPPLMPYKTDKRGWGLKTLVDVKKGDFIIEYVGEMIDEEEYKRRVKIMHKNQEDNYYFLIIDKDRMLDAGPKGNVSRFMNHSCDPNCETQKWTVNGDTRVGLFALKNIAANSELVFNYNLVTQGNEMKPCFCGSEKCSGFIGVKAIKNGNSSNDEEMRKKSNEDAKKRSIDDQHRKIIRYQRKKRGHDQHHLLDNCETLLIEGGHVKKRKNVQLKRRNRNNCFLNKSKKSRYNGRKMEEHFKTSSRNRFKKNIELLMKNRDVLKQKIMEKRSVMNKQSKLKEPKIERRGRKKMPRNEQEKQELLFQMIKRRIERKFEEMSTLCTLDDECFICGKIEGERLFCDNNKCPRAYHLDCLNRTKWPTGRWLCPWHYCSICKSIRKVKKCAKCINSYCCLHAENNIFFEEDAFVCKKHCADPTLFENTTENEVRNKVQPVEMETEKLVDENQPADKVKTQTNVVPGENFSVVLRNHRYHHPRSRCRRRRGRHRSRSWPYPHPRHLIYPKNDISSPELSKFKNETICKNRNVENYHLGRRKLRKNVKCAKPVETSKCGKITKNVNRLKSNGFVKTNVKYNVLHANASVDKIHKSKRGEDQIDQSNVREDVKSGSESESNKLFVSYQLKGGEDSNSLNEFGKTKCQEEISKKSDEEKMIDEISAEMVSSEKDEQAPNDVEKQKETADLYVNNMETSDDEYIINWEVEVINDEESN